jgi:ADP-ribosylglycohydrolase
LNAKTPVPEVKYDGWLLRVKGLYTIGAPGITCISSLLSGAMGTLEQSINNSKGCGGVMRTAPAGLFYSKEEVFDRAAAFAAIIHGHPLGYYSAGLFALIICNIISGMAILDAVIDVQG